MMRLEAPREKTERRKEDKKGVIKAEKRGPTRVNVILECEITRDL